MKSMISKKYLIYSVRAVLLILLAGGLIFCAFSGYEDADYIASFFSPEVSNKGNASPFFRSLQFYYKDPSIFDTNEFTEVNVREWKGFFDNKVSEDDLRLLLYTDSNTGYIDTLIFFAKDPKYPISTAWRKNSINGVADMHKRLEFLYYLGFAKRCEPYVTTPAQIGWDEKPNAEETRAKAARKELLDKGPKLTASLHIPFVRQRAHFQMVRLLFMNAEYEQCSRYMDEHRREIDSAGTSVIRFRTLSYGATALYRQKEYAKANYLFSLIFDQMPYMRKTAMFYFHPMEEKDWQQSLAMAKTSHERSVMWAMTGIKETDEMRAIEEIYKVEPSSELLDLLLVRLVNVAEEPYLETKYKLQVSAWGGDNDSMASMKKELESIKGMMDDTRLHNRPLWYLSAGYLAQMEGRYAEANADYDKACKLAPADSLVAQQAHVLHIVANAELTTVLDTKRENELLADLKWLTLPHNPIIRTSAAYDAVRKIISKLYLKQNDPIMSHLAAGFSTDFYLQDSNTYKMLAFFDKPNKRPMEEHFRTIYEKSKPEIIYFLGLEELYRGHLIAAKEKCMISSVVGDSLPADPFLIHIRDCHDCDHAAKQKVKYTRLTFLNRMIDLERQAQSNDKKSAQAYFDLADGYYNITYFGNCRMFYENAITSTTGEFSSEHWNPSGKVDVPQYAPDVFNCALALQNYLKAREASSDKEFKAKCTYMAAKCERNMSTQALLKYEEGQTSFNDGVDFGKYFMELKANYSNTAYEKEVIRECSYFSYYAKLPK